MPFTDITFAKAAALVTGSRSYIDTAKVYVDRLIEDAELVGLLNMAGTVIRLGAMPHQGSWRSGLMIHQPTPEILEYIAGAFDQHIVSRFDISLDLLTADRSGAATVQEFLTRRLIQPRRAKDPVKRYKTTVYYARASARNNLVLYSDLPSKIAGGPCCHLDWRITGGSAVRAAGVNSTTDLLVMDLRDFWARRLVLRELPTYEDLRKIGRALHRNPRGRSRLMVPLGRGIVVDRFPLAASVFLRSTATSSEWTIQEVLANHGNKWAKYFPPLPTEWMLPLQPHD